MNTVKRVLRSHRVLAALLFILGLSVDQTLHAQSSREDRNTGQEPDWAWEDAEGNPRTRADLDDILELHQQWLESDRKSGLRADLSEAKLAGADLQGTNLREARLRGVDLRQANLVRANLVRAQFVRASLSNAEIRGADLTDADLKESDLTDTRLHNANLSGAGLEEAVLVNAWLSEAKLFEANLIGANLAGARLNDSDLSWSDLRATDFTGADLARANLANSYFGPKTLPDVQSIARAQGLELVTYWDSPDSITQLRKRFRDGGFIEQERKLTYALKRRQAEILWENCSLKHPLSCLEYGFNLVLFDWTCAYGMRPGKALELAFWLWLICSVIYSVIMHRAGTSGIYRVELVFTDENARTVKEAILKTMAGSPVKRSPTGEHLETQIRPEAIVAAKDWRYPFRLLWREFQLLRKAMFFSLISAFNIGFRDINFGRWLRLLTRKEYDLKAVGSARVVFGCQSLISVVLIALFILSYFGRPFEG